MAAKRGRPPKSRPGTTTPSPSVDGTDGAIANGVGGGEIAADSVTATDPNTVVGAFTEPVPLSGTAETGTFSTGAAGTETGQKRRGRPPGAGRKTSPIDLSGIEALLLGIHTTLLHATGVQEFELSQEEAHEVAKAYSAVATFYPAFALDPKIAAIVNLGTTVSIVYGTRITSWRMRRAAEKSRGPHPSARDIPGSSRAAASPPADQMNGSKPDVPRDVPREVRVGQIPGVGEIEFPADDPMITGRRN